MRAAVVVLAVLLGASCGSSSGTGGGGDDQGHVTRATFDGTWPLTVDSGTLRCEGAGAVTFTTEDGTTYAVNGLALGMHTYPDIDAIWADAPDTPKVFIGDLIQAGLALCPA